MTQRKLDILFVSNTTENSLSMSNNTENILSVSNPYTNVATLPVYKLKQVSEVLVLKIMVTMVIDSRFTLIAQF